MLAGPDLAINGVTHWRCIDLCGVIGERYKVEVHQRPVGKLLRRMGLTRLQPRRITPRRTLPRRRLLKGTEALPFDVIDLTPTTVAAYRQPASVDRPSAISSISRAVRHTASPGDSLKVRIFERYGGNIFPSIQGQSADLGIQRVAEDGTIKVPVVGVV